MFSDIATIVIPRCKNQNKIKLTFSYILLLNMAQMITIRLFMGFSDMKEKRDCPGVAVFHGKIYVFGGSYGNVIVDSVECYSPMKDEWQHVTSLPLPRHGFRCCSGRVHQDHIVQVSIERPKLKEEKLI